MLVGERGDLLEELEANDGEADDFQKALEGWFLDRLQFMKAVEATTGSAVLRYHYRRSQRGKQTLLAQQEFLRWFHSAIDGSANKPEFGPPLTRALAYRRETARYRGVGLARLGNPIIDGVHEHLQWDDRGTSFAVWRHTARLNATEIRACFRFDFVVEANLDALDEWIRTQPGLSSSAVRRKADGAFPPIIETVWVDHQLRPLSDESLEDVNRPLRKEVDWNVNQDRWPLVLRRFESHRWSDLCASARRVAEELLRQQQDLANVIQQSLLKFEEAYALVREQGESRFEALARHPAEQTQLRLEMISTERIANGIADGIREPKIRLDAAGVVFLAGSPLIVS
jgi:ATP-dependent helicase HepA